MSSADEAPEDADRVGVAHIHASLNNTIITLTDLTGAETLAKSSGGSVVKQSRNESTPYAAMQMAEEVAEAAQERGISTVHVRIRAPGGNMNTNPDPGHRRRYVRSHVPDSKSDVSRT